MEFIAKPKIGFQTEKDERIGTLETENAKLKAEVMELKKENAKLQEHIADLEKTKLELEQQVLDLQSPKHKFGFRPSPDMFRRRE